MFAEVCKQCGARCGMGDWASVVTLAMMLGCFGFIFWVSMRGLDK